MKNFVAGMLLTCPIHAAVMFIFMEIVVQACQPALGFKGVSLSNRYQPIFTEQMIKLN